MCVSRVSEPILAAYATCSARPKGDRSGGGCLPGSATASSSARSYAALPARRDGSFLPSRRRQQLKEELSCWEGALNAVSRFPNSELVLNWLLLPLHPLWPPKEANFPRGLGSSLLPSPEGGRPSSSRRARSVVPPKSDRSLGSWWRSARQKPSSGLGALCRPCQRPSVDLSHGAHPPAPHPASSASRRPAPASA